MATSLENLNVKIGIDMSDLTKGIREVNAQFKQIDSSVRATSSGFDVMGNTSASLKAKIEGLSQKITLQKDVVKSLKDEYEKAVNSKDSDAKATEALSKKLNDATTNLNKMQLQLKDTNKELRDTPNLFNKMSDSMNKISSKMSSIGKTLTIGVTAPLVALATLGVKYNADMEQYQAGLETMLGSADKATKMLNDLKTMANKTPFETTDLVKGSQTLLAYGLDAQAIIPALQNLGDVSLGNKDKFNSLTLAYGQTQAKGRLMGQEAMQMTEAGFNPLQQISQRTGETMLELSKRMEKGGISTAEVTQAFKDATSEGGRFYGAMDKQSQTLTGRLSTLKDGFSQTIGKLTESLLPTISKIMDKLSQLVTWFSTLDEGSKNTILTFVALAIAIGPIISVLGFIGTAIGFLSGAFGVITTVVTVLAGALNLPVIAFVGIIAGIVALGIIIFKFRDQIWEFIKGVGTAIIDFIAGIPEFLSRLLKNIVDFIVSIPEKIAYGLGLIIGTLAKFFINIITSLATFISNIPQYINNIVNFFKELPSKIWNTLVNVLVKIGEFIVGMKNKIATSVPEIINNFVDFFKGLPGKITDIGKNIVDGLLQGIKNAWANLTSAVGKMVDSFVKGIKKGLGINSPSKILADEVGQWIPKGIAVGIDANTDSVKKSLANVSNMTKKVNLQSEYGSGTNTNNTYNSPINFVIENFHNDRGDSIEELNKKLGFLTKKTKFATGGAY